METDIMGQVLTEVTIENLKDKWDAERGMLPAEQARQIKVPDALVDTGATLLSLPTRLIQQLGLKQTATKRVRTCSGQVTEAPLDEAVHLTIGDRFCTTDVLEVPDTVPVLIGQLPLEALDLVVDMRGRRLIGNPAHGGEHMFDLF